MVTSNSASGNEHLRKKLKKVRSIGIILTLLGLILFSYFVYSVGLNEILQGISNIGISGFAIILGIYFLRVVIRAFSWKLCVYEPYELRLRDTVPAVIIGEALSSMIPLGILISGTGKAVAVRKRVPLVVGLSSVATENLFYSLGTGLFISLGAVTFLRNFDLSEGWVWTLDVLLGLIFLILLLGALMVIRQWHWASGFCEFLYARGIGRSFLQTGLSNVRLFENLIYGFYRRHPERFFPLFGLQVVFHSLGIAEIWFILSRLTEGAQSVYTAFLLESISRVITVVFKLVPFLVGVDEAGSQFVTETLALGAGLGVTIAIIRKGRILFWAATGLVIILKRGLSISDIFHRHEHESNGTVEYSNSGS